MKATIGIGLLVVAASCAAAACADKQPPPREPSTTNTTTTTTGYSPSYLQSPPQESASSTTSEPSANKSAAIVHPEPMAAPLDPALSHDPGASPRPVVGPTEPGPVNAKAPDQKSPNVSAATDQGNSKLEVQISSRIRRTMMVSKTLSFGAKNAKVITSGTKVTLRGTVKSDAEKNEIAGIARSTDGVTDVDDQLVVKQ